MGAVCKRPRPRCEETYLEDSIAFFSFPISRSATFRVAGLVRPGDGLTLFVQQRHRTGGHVVESQVAACDLGPRTLRLFADTGQNANGLLLIQDDRHPALELFGNLGPEVLIEIIVHLFDVDSFHGTE